MAKVRINEHNTRFLLLIFCKMAYRLSLYRYKVKKSLVSQRRIVKQNRNALRKEN